MIATCVAELGGLDVMFNNAGFNKPQPFLEVTEEVWHQIMNVNALGVLMGSQEAAKMMIDQGTGGKIVNTASIVGREGFPSFVPYCVSKFGVIAITQGAARVLAEHNITVNVFAPGVVATPLWEQLDLDLMEIGDSDRPGQAMEDFSAGILKGFAAVPIDIAGTARFLASTDSGLHDRTGDHDRRWDGARMSLKFDPWYDFRNPPQWYRNPADLYAETLDQISWADDLGFSCAWVSEHHFTEEGYLPAVFSALAAMAMRTSKMRLGTSVLLAPLHHPLRLAEEAAVVDAISGGRLELGLAPGYRVAEFDTMGVPKSQRGARTDEIIELLIKAWTEDRVNHEGLHYQFSDVAVGPKPVQDPYPSLWIGGSSLVAARRAARFGCKFMPDSGAAPEVFTEYSAGLAAAGHSAGELATNMVVYVCDDPEQRLGRGQGALLLRVPVLPAAGLRKPVIYCR